MSFSKKQLITYAVAGVLAGIVAGGIEYLQIAGGSVEKVVAQAEADSSDTSPVTTGTDDTATGTATDAPVTPASNVGADTPVVVGITVDGIKVLFSETANTAIPDDRMVELACNVVGDYRAKGIKAFIAGADKTTVLNAVVDNGEGASMLALQRDAAGKGWVIAAQAAKDTAHPESIQRLRDADANALAEQLSASCVERNSAGE